MAELTKPVISLYTEATPNPRTLKFVCNRMLFSGNSVDYRNVEEVQGSSDLADILFALDYVEGIFISNNFVTVTKNDDKDWIEVQMEIKNTIKTFLEEEKLAVNEAVIAERAPEEEMPTNEDDTEIVIKIKNMLKKYVQPAVEMDGGSIVFRKYDDGIVTLGMQGACSGCPSSTVTLKAGIEGMMKRMIPEVKEVVAQAM